MHSEPLPSDSLQVQPCRVHGTLEAGQLLLLRQDHRQRRERVSQEPTRPLARPLVVLGFCWLLRSFPEFGTDGEVERARVK